jgi:hypothetical protein
MKTNSLDKLYKFDRYGVCSFRTLIHKNVFVRGEVASVPVIQYNRTKYNRMNGYEQEAYEKKLNTLKTEYRLYYTDTVFTTVTKEVYLYFAEYSKVNLPECSEADYKHLFKLA